MLYQAINLRILIRVILLGLVMFMFVFSINQDKWYMTSAVTFVISIVILIELIYFLHRDHRNIARFLSSIKQHDFSGHYTKSSPKKSKKYLEDILNEINREFENVRIEKEVHYQFLQTIIQHIRIAIICYDENDKIILINDSAKRIFGLRHLNDIQSLEKINPSLMTAIQTVNPNETRMVKHMVDDDLLQLSLSGTTFKLRDQLYKLVSLQNIKAELEAQELESWKKLIRILTHEIMNSVTPISSLSTAVNRMLADNAGIPLDIGEVDPDDIDDIRNSMKTIEDRSKGLLHFVEDYKSLTKIPAPEFTEVKVKELVSHLKILFEQEMLKHNIDLQIQIHPEDLVVIADHDQIEQVLINLLLNAKDALKDIADKIIKINAFKDDNQTVIQFIDNGHGIDPDNIGDIFIPFFTTKKEGSGIGLSLSRQIIQMHGGRISVKSEQNVGTVITLRF